MNFPTNLKDIQERIERIEPKDYARSRNYIDGSVSYLSPYISRGVISTKDIMLSLFDRGFTFSEAEKFIQELAWRDYWQQIWIEKGSHINQDLKHTQSEVTNHKISSAILNAKTNITAIDKAIQVLYIHGYIHNHIRMYIAAICCNMAHSHWLTPAKWMYYHLKDGDWASNALSWQWVCGANSNKKYIANQENINKYCHTTDEKTFTDTTYEEILNLPIPDILKELEAPSLTTSLLLNNISPIIDSSLPTLIYNYYNISVYWHKDLACNRVLLLEPSVFEQYPVSKSNIDFAIKLATQNIENIQVVVMEFEDFKRLYKISDIRYKEHPLNNYHGIEEPRDWMFTIKGYYPSFFTFWNKCKKEFKSISEK